jgi:hypothetical protein
MDGQGPFSMTANKHRTRSQRMRKLILIALAIGMTAVVAACGSNDENKLTSRP